MPELNEIPKEVANVALDAAYVVVGLGVLGVHRVQVRRQELQSWLDKQDFGVGTLEDRVGDARTELGRRAGQVDGFIESAITQVEASLQPLEEQLPRAAREAMAQAQAQGRELRGFIRERLIPAA